MSNSSKSRFVKPPDQAHINVLLYGGPKQGKTVGATTAPGPILLLNADRPNATRFAHSLRPDIDEMRVEGLETIIDALQIVDEGQHKTVVVDPVGELYRILLEEQSGRALSPKIQHYGDAGTHLERFARALCDRPVNVVFVCHEMPHKNEESGGFEYLPYTGTNNPSLGGKLMAMVDVIGYCGRVEGEGNEETRYMAGLANVRGKRGGDRFGVLGVAREIDLTEWADAIAAAEDERRNSQTNSNSKNDDKKGKKQ